MASKIIAQGAEALLTKKGNTVIKSRIKKGYRLQILDEKIRKQRTRKEARILQKVSSLIPVPRLLSTSEETTTLNLEYIKGKKLSQHLNILKNNEEICKTIGQQLAKLHDTNIIHGDLTTSNMIISPNNKLYFIDFGLSFDSPRVEDKAVDLHLLKEALEARHYQKAKTLFKAVLEGYQISKNTSLVLQRLKAVEKRGRYKEAY